MTTTTASTTSDFSGDPLIPADVATDRETRRRGLLGLDHYRRILVLAPARQIHTFGMRFAIDVAWCNASGTVLRTALVVPNRLSAWIPRAHAVLEAEAGAFVRLGIAPGDRLVTIRVGGDEGTLLVKCPLVKRRGQVVKCPDTAGAAPHLGDGDHRCTARSAGAGGDTDRQPR
ncbi:MAG TPA: DUF192 domain-containing protein [Acidimicrobiales bacterium]|nr:DUF192 domain-containing protein [Acidimicrobiales bacterium]